MMPDNLLNMKAAHPRPSTVLLLLRSEKGEEPSASRDSTDSENRQIFNLRDPDINNFMTWGPNTFPMIDFSKIQITEEMDFSTLRSYFALAIIL